jgi:hypothetical protein
VVQPLFDTEVVRYMRQDRGVASIMFYACPQETLLNHIRSKTIEIATANPWLLGKINKDGKSFTFPSVFNPDDQPSLDKLLHAPSGASLSRTATYHEINDFVVASHAVDGGNRLKGKDIIVCKVTVVEISNAKSAASAASAASAVDAALTAPSSALIFSLSHVVGDGYTYFRLLNMFGASSEVFSLDPVRVGGAKQSDPVERRLLGPEINTYGTSAAFIKQIVWNNVLVPNKQHGAGKYVCRYVDENKVAAEKQKAVLAGAEFVSTNDVLTSQYGNWSGVRNMMMTINLRGREPTWTANHAGNYENVLLFDPESYETPNMIRRAISEKPICAKSGRKLPGFCEAATMSFISSWMFPLNVDVPGVGVQELFLPVLAMDPTFKNNLGTPIDTCIVFAPQPGRTAMLLVPKLCPEKGANGYADVGSVLGEVVCSSAFREEFDASKRK